MSIRKEIKKIIEEHGSCVISHTAALTAIADVVARPKPIKSPKPLPSRAALTEEVIAAARERVGEFFETKEPKPKPELTEQKTDSLAYEVMRLTVIHHREAGEFHVKIDHGVDTDTVVVALAAESLKQFCVEQFGEKVVPVSLNEIAEILKKF